MSIRSAIKRHLRAQRLFVFNPELASDRCERLFIYDKEINDLLEGQWESGPSARRIGWLIADIESFVRGHEVVISLVPYQADAALFGRLSRATERIWDFRSRHPSPGIRIFGCWAEVDTFVGLGWYPRSLPWNGREPLGGRDSHSGEGAKLECKTKWDQLFPQFEKIGGEDIHDYISEKVTAANSL
jgi:hypothetical protein